MAPSKQSHHPHGFDSVASFIQSTTSGFLSLLNPKHPHPPVTAPFPSLFSSHRPTASPAVAGGSSSRVIVPLHLSNVPLIPVSLPSLPEPTPNNSSSMNSLNKSSAVRNDFSSDSESGVSPVLRDGGLRKGRIGGRGPAFAGQVYSMCDLSGRMIATSDHSGIPFLPIRVPEWMKKMLRTVIKGKDDSAFHLFTHLGDAVNHAKRWKITSGIVGACRLDLAYESFKENPHLFHFVPNEKQVKEANKLLKGTGKKRRVDGVPVFSAQNVEIAIATADGIKWYTPYFFDKNILDNILEESSDHHFHSLIQSRDMQRRHDAVDDNLSDLPPEVIEEAGDDSMWDSLEVEELMDEVGFPEIPFSVVSKVAEVQLMHAVDSLLLGNRWLRKAIGIQPKFPYMVDSFEKRSAASLLRASKERARLIDLEAGDHNYSPSYLSSEVGTSEDGQCQSFQEKDFCFPHGNWSKQPWSKHPELDSSEHANMIEQSRLLPKITLIGVSTNDPGRQAILQKTIMDKLTEEYGQDGHDGTGNSSSHLHPKERDPLFVGNLGRSLSWQEKGDF